MNQDGSQTPSTWPYSSIPTVSQGDWLWTKVTFSDNNTSISKTYSSIDGLNQATINLYQRTASSPSLPNDTVIYNFSTGKFKIGSSSTWVDSIGNWVKSIPAVDSAHTDYKCYIISAIASSNTEEDTIAASEWTGPNSIIENGLNQAVVRMYQRAATQPTGSNAKPSTSLTYTFSSGTLNADSNGWQRNIPSTDGNPCWVISAVASSQATTDTIDTTDWGAPIKLVEDGKSATVYNLSISDAVIIKNESGNYSPSSITLNSYSKTGNSNITSFNGYFEIETTTDGSTWTSVYTSSTGESSKQYTIPSGIKNIRCSLYKESNRTTLLDQQTVPIVSDGIDGKDAYTVILTNENYTFAGNNSSAIGENTTCDVITYKGTFQVNCYVGASTSATSISTGITGLTCSISNNNTNIVF